MRSTDDLAWPARSSSSEYSRSSHRRCRNETGSLKNTGMGILLRSLPMQLRMTAQRLYFLFGLKLMAVLRWRPPGAPVSGGMTLIEPRCDMEAERREGGREDAAEGSVSSVASKNSSSSSSSSPGGMGTTAFSPPASACSLLACFSSTSCSFASVSTASSSLARFLRSICTDLRRCFSSVSTSCRNWPHDSTSARASDLNIVRSDCTSRSSGYASSAFSPTLIVRFCKAEHCFTMSSWHWRRFAIFSAAVVPPFATTLSVSSSPSESDSTSSSCCSFAARALAASRRAIHVCRSFSLWARRLYTCAPVESVRLSLSST
eukprot:Opistho-1_new@103146